MLSLGEKTDSNDMDRLKYVNWVVHGRPGGYWSGGGLGSENGTGMARRYQPFARRHDASCKYFGVRGNGRFKYLYDDACVLDGAGEWPPFKLLTGAGFSDIFGVKGDIATLDSFLGLIKNESNVNVFVGSHSIGGGGFGDGSFKWMIRPPDEVNAVSGALKRAGSFLDFQPSSTPVLLGLMARVPSTTVNENNKRLALEDLQRDTTSYIGNTDDLIGRITAAIGNLKASLPSEHVPETAHTGMSRNTKIAIGVGAAAVLVGGVMLARRGSKPLGGARRRRRGFGAASDIPLTFRRRHARNVRIASGVGRFMGGFATGALAGSLGSATGQYIGGHFRGLRGPVGFEFGTLEMILGLAVGSLAAYNGGEG